MAYSSPITYSVADDTADGVVHLTTLTGEIQASSITIALDYITVDGDDLDISFKADISDGEKTILDGVVAAHTGAAPTNVRNVRFDEPHANDDTTIFTLKEYSPTSGISGKYIRFPGEFVAAANDITVWEWYVPFRMGILAGGILGSATDDHISFCVAPDTIVGVLTASADEGQVWLDVSSTVVQNLQRGYFVRVTGSPAATPFDDLPYYWVVDVDEDNNRIMIEQAIIQASPLGLEMAKEAGDYVKLTVFFAYDYDIRSETNVWHILGDQKFGSTALDRGTVLRLYYKNGGDEKTVRFWLDFIY